MPFPVVHIVALTCVLDVASALVRKGSAEPLVQPLSKSGHTEWWLTLNQNAMSQQEHVAFIAKWLPSAWLHVPKCGESLLNAIVHIPGACPSMPADFEVQTLHGFFHTFGKPEVACPGCFNPRWFGTHRGIASDSEFTANFKGHGVIMLRQPEQRIISAWRDFRHSWPYPAKPLPNTILEFAEGIQGCATKMLTRGGESYFVNTSYFYPTTGPHWGGPCGSPEKPSVEEIVKAKARLEDFVFVGITDKWQMSMCLFHAIIRKPCQAADFLNSRTPNQLDHPDYPAAAILPSFHDPYDGELYDYAMILFEQNLEKYNLSPETCKSCFDEAGVVFNGS